MHSPLRASSIAFAGSLVVAAVVAACSGSNTTSTSSGAGGSTSSSTSTSVTSSSTTAASTTGSAMADTWTNFAEAFYAKYCVECHGAGNPNRDYTTLAGVMKDAALDRCGVSTKVESGCSGNPAPKQFPISNAAGTNPKPTDQERTRVVAWIDAGLPN